MQMKCSCRNFYVMVYHSISIILFSGILFASINKTILQNNKDQLVISININAETEADLRPASIMIGLPTSNLPKTQIQFLNKDEIPFKSHQKKTSDFEWINKQKLCNLEVATLHISPLANSNEYFKTIKVSLDFERERYEHRKPNKNEFLLLKNRIVNWDIAQNWILKKERITSKITNYTPGRWFQFFLTEDGMVSIPYSSLSNVIDNISNIDPRSFSIYMSNEFGRARSQSTNQEIAPNLVEIGIWVQGEEDGVFDINDRIIFYGRGPSGYDVIGNDLDWHQNIYFSKNSCWLFIPNDSSLKGKRIHPASQPESVAITLDYGISAIHEELDLVNLKGEGTVWLSNSIPAGTSQNIVVDLFAPKPSVDISIKARVYGFSNPENALANHSISLRFGGLDGETIGNNATWTSSSFLKRDIVDTSPNITLNNGINVFYLRNMSDDSKSMPHFDFFEIQYGRELSFEDSYNFKSPISGQNIRFSFTGVKQATQFMWDITDVSNPESMVFSELNYINVTVPTALTKYFIVFDTNTLPEITEFTIKEDQEFFTLRQSGIQADYIVTGPEIFRDEATELVYLRSPAIFASLETIYDEFSAGNKDPMGIRSFIQWALEKWTEPVPTFLMILGDSGYDYRNITGQSSIVFPTIQTTSYATDDKLATLNGNVPEVAIGRFPARDESEVTNFIEKVLVIESNPDLGPWRQRVTIMADDGARPEPGSGSIEVGKSHTLYSEILADLVPSSLNVQKIYMQEYPEVSDASAFGVLKPDATEDVFKALNKGTAIISYIGHGSPYQLAQEKLLSLNRGDINQINTGQKMPIWIVGTCSFGHFDDPLTESFAEELIREPLNAASMIISTSRKISVSGNSRYTRELFERIFANDQVTDSPIGVILQIVKDGAPEGQYFHLFGDPAMSLPMPKDILNITGVTPDTLKTLGIATFNGQQSSFDGDGAGYVVLIDADREVTREYQINSQTESLTYSLPGPTLFRGQFSFAGEIFAGDIRIPQDISYSNDPARLVIYINDENKEASGVLNGLQLTGGDGTNDTFGPKITFETESGQSLENGDHFPEDQNLIIRMSDPLGINLTDETGHEILVTDLLSNQSETITQDFYYDTNSIMTGTISFSPSSGKEIKLLVKVWDNANNPNEKKIHLSRTSAKDLKIYNAYNYPNPFSTFTQFAFELTQTADIKLDIFSLGGRRVKSFDEFSKTPGYHTIDWDGLDSFGSQIANGVYLYRLKAFGENSSETYIGRCAKYQ